MAVVKISELVVAGALTGAELMEAVQGGVNKKVTIQDIANFAGPSFYSTNGQLASDRTVDLNGKFLMFQQGVTGGFIITDGVSNLFEVDRGGLSSNLQATDGTVQTRLSMNANLVGNDVSFNLKADDGTNQVEITGDAQAQTITLTAANGTKVVGGLILNYTAQTSTYPIVRSDYTIDCTGTFTATLPTAVGFGGQIYNIKNSGGGVITIATTGGQTIDGSATKTAIAGVNVQVMSTGSNWIIL